MDVTNRDFACEGLKYVQYLYQATKMKSRCLFPPHQFFVEATNICNLKCEMCIQDKMKRPKGVMKLALMKKVIDEVCTFDPFFDFCRQGEPLINKNLPEMIEYASQKGMTKTRLITNGTLLTEQVSERLIRGGLRKINISFNGYDKESYERIQKGAKYERTVKNLIDLLKIKYELRSPYPSVEVSIVAYDDLGKNLQRFARQFDKLPVDRIRVSQLINFFGSNEYPKLNENIKMDHKAWPSCKVPFRFFNINWDGSVTPCIVDYDAKCVVGNVHNNSVMEIWNNETLARFRGWHIDKRFDEIEKYYGNDFCTRCSNLWADPGTNGPQYPRDLESGLDDFFKKDRKGEDGIKLMAGNFEKDIFRSKKELDSIFSEFIKHEDVIENEILTAALPNKGNC